MVTSKLILTSKTKIILFCFSLVFVVSSCRVTLVPSYDEEVAAQIEDTAKQINTFYLQMLENQNERDYENYVNEYISIQVELNSLYNKNKVKSLNKNSTRICEITLQLWKKYKEEHKNDETLSDGIIKLNRKTFEDLLYAMQVAEKGKEIKNNPAN
ncbi:hypothetical protein [Mesonia sp. K4-1]|uniref:hypothetical protein n=1 Tax=Mesonia sp. K4-1 TaxID=2602760 RepID=UPI0011C8E14C|nr:hypothetical protein [Mesonia sp. K4-1]TXK76068.1 hypothetical protein FT986_07870 [Mesonia sp. K4-1]